MRNTAIGLAARPRNGDLDGLLTELANCADAADLAGAPSKRAAAALRGAGVLGTVIPEACGGIGADSVTVNHVVERIAQVDPSMAIILFQHFAVSSRILEWGSLAQKAEILPRLASGEWLAASAWSETGAGADKRRLSTRACHEPDGSWVLDGAKSFTTGAGLADVYLVLAQTADGSDPGVYGAGGQSFFLVEASNPGLVADTSLDLAGMRASATGFIELRDCRLPAGALLGPLDQAALIIASVRNSGASLGAVALGIALAAHRLTREHLGRWGLLEHQAVRYRLVDLETQIEAARALVATAGRREGPEAGMTTLHSKLFAASVAEQVVSECQRLLGSAGFVRENPINRMASDARAIGLMGPTGDVCRELVSLRWRS